MTKKIRKYKMSGCLQAVILPNNTTDPHGHFAYKEAQSILDSICKFIDESAFLPAAAFSRTYEFQNEELTLDLDADAGDVTFIPSSDVQLENLLSILMADHGYEISL